VAGGDTFLKESLGNFGNQLQKRETGVDVARALAGLLDQSRHIVTGHVEQTLEALGLLVRVNVGPLIIFDLSLVLLKLSMTSTTMDSWT
jgi:hypothetical protein